MDLYSKNIVIADDFLVLQMLKTLFCLGNFAVYPKKNHYVNIVVHKN